MKTNQVKYELTTNNHRIVLAYDCHACGGTGEIALEDKTSTLWDQCENCDGLGYTVTEDGSQILALVNDVLLKGGK